MKLIFEKTLKKKILQDFPQIYLETPDLHSGLAIQLLSKIVV